MRAEEKQAHIEEMTRYLHEFLHELVISRTKEEYTWESHPDHEYDLFMDRLIIEGTIGRYINTLFDRSKYTSIERSQDRALLLVDIIPKAQEQKTILVYYTPRYEQRLLFPCTEDTHDLILKRVQGYISQKKYAYLLTADEALAIEKHLREYVYAESEDELLDPPYWLVREVHALSGYRHTHKIVCQIIQDFLTA